MDSGRKTGGDEEEVKPTQDGVERKILRKRVSPRGIKKRRGSVKRPKITGAT